MIELQDIVKSYSLGERKVEVLRGLNLSVKPGEMVAIMGPSGSGKTTLLNIVGCLDRPTSGSYVLDGREVSQLGSADLAKVRGQKIGFVFQSFNLLPHLSALANVELGLRYAGGGDGHRAMDALARVGLAERAKHRPPELSGGEQQRVAIARALVKNPPLVLADEPTGNLDSRTSDEILDILDSLHAEQGITLVMITHEEGIAHRCQRLIRLKDGQVVSEEKV
ncbi:MAG: ABC transporter ATP-binding protein [Chloroflexi bacterium]|nr:ABC transporter ATP-binding protein [Chloroflexota bacterium]